VRRNSIAFLSGALFAVGLAVSGMTQPARIVGFLDFAGRWDPTLALVMGGALGVMIVAQRLTRRLSKPVFAGSFPLPSPITIDARLVGGAALFGVGWGIGGFCPGPAVVSLGAATPPAIVFTAAMAAGMVLFFVLCAPKRSPTPGPAIADHDR